MYSTSTSSSVEPPAAHGVEQTQRRRRLFLAVIVWSLLCLASTRATGELSRANAFLAGCHTLWALGWLAALAMLHARRGANQRREQISCGVLGVLQLLGGVGFNLF